MAASRWDGRTTCRRSSSARSSFWPSQSTGGEPRAPPMPDEAVMSETVLDAHVHFWDPSRLEYPWLKDEPALLRPFLPQDYAEAMEGVPVEGIIFVEANPRPDRTL